MESAGHAVEEAETARALYAVAAARWLDEGRTAHYALLPSHDADLVHTWFRLAFGHQHTHAIREPAPAGPVPDGLVVRQPERSRDPQLARLDMVLTEHQALAPTFSGGPPDVYEERVADWEEDFDNPKFWNVVVEHDGALVGSAVGCALEVSSSHTGPARPDHAAFLGFAAVLPRGPRSRCGTGARRGRLGLGRGRGLPEHRHRLARDEPALLTGLAGPRLPRHLHPGAPARRALTRRDRVLGHHSSGISHRTGVRHPALLPLAWGPWHLQARTGPHSRLAPWSRAPAAVRTTIALKILMAVSGGIFILFVLLHMYGNLKAFAGHDAFNEYAHHLRTLGEPMLPHEGALWVIRAALVRLAGGARVRRVRAVATCARAPAPRRT